jgi:hypothetical protein
MFFAATAVTASENVMTRSVVGDTPVASSAGESAETVGAVVSGAVVSIVTLDASVAELGPVLVAVSLTDPEASRSMTVPSVVQTTVTVIEVPEAADGVIDEHVAVPPELLKSPAAIPLTLSENANV